MQKPISVVFVSNFYTFHQEALSEALYRQTGGRYRFIETRHVRGEQKQQDLDIDRPYVMQYWEPSQRPLCDEMLLEADVVLIGGAPDALIVPRLKKNKLTFRYSERLYKEPITWKNFLHAFGSAWKHHGRFQRRPLHMLCASAFTAADCRKFGNYRDRTYRWGYFPAVKAYDITELMAQKRPMSILWVGRLISLKHPEHALAMAQQLKKLGLRFDLRFVGDGPLRKRLEMQTAALDLTDCVHFLGKLPPDQTRKVMELSEIFLFTSDRREGWGAVLNEAMNGGCATVSAHCIGSVPFLIDEGKNGLVYASGDVPMLTQRVQWLLEHPKEREEIGKQAYQTVTELWNAETAAERLLTLSGELLCGQRSAAIFTDGPCSLAELRKDDWYHGV